MPVLGLTRLTVYLSNHAVGLALRHRRDHTQGTQDIDYAASDVVGGRAERNSILANRTVAQQIAAQESTSKILGDIEHQIRYALGDGIGTGETKHVLPRKGRDSIDELD